MITLMWNKLRTGWAQAKQDWHEIGEEQRAIHRLSKFGLSYDVDPPTEDTEFTKRMHSIFNAIRKDLSGDSARIQEENNQAAQMVFGEDAKAGVWIPADGDAPYKDIGVPYKVETPEKETQHTPTLPSL